MASSGGSGSSGSIRQYIPMANKYDRIIVLVDMDCFFCQVEARLDPTLRGKPIAVVQYNTWRGGGIIAVNYEARAKGVTRHMRGDEASLRCPDIVLVKVPNLGEKANLSKYRDAGKEVANVLQRFTTLIERASVDEAYLDITDKVNQRLEAMTTGTYLLEPQKLLNTYAVGYDNFGDYVNGITSRFVNKTASGDDDGAGGGDNDIEDCNYADVHDVSDVAAVRQSDLRLLLGASIAGEIRAAVKAETSYECSAGIAHNKIMAKLVCGINKPNKQTILPLNQIPKLFDTWPVGKITGLGGKLGEEVCERLKIRFVGQLLRFTKSELHKKFDEKNGQWLYNICRGIDLEAVTPRFYSKSIGCCKKFPGRNNITGINTLKHWMSELAKEICDRLEKDLAENNRRARQMVVNYVQNIDGEEISSSRSTALPVVYDAETIVRSGLDLIKSNTKQFFRAGSETLLHNEIRFLGFSVGKFETITSGQGKLQEMFANQAAKRRRIATDEAIAVKETVSSVVAHSAGNESEKSSAVVNNVKSFFLKAMAKEANNSSTTNDTKSNQSASATAALSSSSGSATPVTEEIIKSNDPPNLKLSDIDETTSTTTNRDEVTSAMINDTTESPNQIRNKELKEVHNVRSFFLNALKNGKNEKSQPKQQQQQQPQEELNSTLKLSQMREPEIVASKSRSFFHNLLAKQQQNKPSVLSVEHRTENNDDASTSEVDTVCDNFPSCSNGILRKTPELTPAIDHEKSPVEENNESLVDAAMHTQNAEQPLEIATPQKPHYTAAYAEYALPDLSLVDMLQMVECTICHAKIPSDERSQQTHQDAHFAQQLSQQQRIEYREEIKSKIIQTKMPTRKNATKKAKTSPPQANKKSVISKGIDITKFLQPKTTTATPTSFDLSTVSDLSLDNCSIVACEICNMAVKIENLQEHKDYHVAKELQQQLNNQTEPPGTSTNVKARRSSNGIANNSIANYFSQPKA